MIMKLPDIKISGNILCCEIDFSDINKATLNVFLFSVAQEKSKISVTLFKKIISRVNYHLYVMLKQIQTNSKGKFGKRGLLLFNNFRYKHQSIVSL